MGESDGFRGRTDYEKTVARKPQPRGLIRHKKGFPYRDQASDTMSGNRSAATSRDRESMTKGLDTPGHVGIAWNGSVQCYIFSIRIIGKLDPKWVAEQIGEAPEEPPKKKKKSKTSEDLDPS